MIGCYAAMAGVGRRLGLKQAADQKRTPKQFSQACHRSNMLRRQEAVAYNKCGGWAPAGKP